jgi:hypothetical protein
MQKGKFSGKQVKFAGGAVIFAFVATRAMYYWSLAQGGDGEARGGRVDRAK